MPSSGGLDTTQRKYQESQEVGRELFYTGETKFFPRLSNRFRSTTCFKQPGIYLLTQLSFWSEHFFNYVIVLIVLGVSLSVYYFPLVISQTFPHLYLKEGREKAKGREK